jgi:hypothetical protein
VLNSRRRRWILYREVCGQACAVTASCAESVRVGKRPLRGYFVLELGARLENRTQRTGRTSSEVCGQIRSAALEAPRRS